ncbi:hypothetical protein CPB85DRAFT_1559840 [Mucidula mucida]|nr:hypothetical protein CPB85DRAFT_1559840 [Mucidula mucida]
MSVPDERELENATRNIVFNAEDISQLTPRVVRELLEKQFALDKGTLDAKEFKKPIKGFIDDAVVQERREDKAKEVSSGPAINSDDEDEVPSAKRKRESSSGKAKSTKKYKSASVIATSDIEEDEPVPPSASKPLKAGVPTPKPKPPPKPKAIPKTTRPKSTSSRISSQLEDVEDGSELDSPSGARKPTPESASPADDDDSALEVENQPPPRKRRKSKSDDKAPAKSSAKPKRAKKTESKDDATIKKLKSYVAACGVRKQWGKIFEDVESTSRQISIIKGILKDLGMDGRMSLDQAKRIREQRELADELEAVQSFEQSALVRGSRSRRGQPDSKPAKGEEEAEQASDEETEKPVTRKPTARQSIMAFLGSDSESD